MKILFGSKVFRFDKQFKKIGYFEILYQDFIIEFLKIKRVKNCWDCIDIYF